MPETIFDASKGSNQATVKTDDGHTVRATNAVMVEGDVTFDNNKGSSQSTVKVGGKTVRAMNVNVVGGLNAYLKKDDADKKYATKDDISTLYKPKGSVPTYDDLPTTNNQIGDVYDVRDTGMNYVWDGDKWDELGPLFGVNILETQVSLAKEIGQTTEMLFDELTPLNINGKPSNKQIGATVYAPDNYIGIISEVKDASVMVTTVYVNLGLVNSTTLNDSLGIHATISQSYNSVGIGYEGYINNSSQAVAVGWHASVQNAPYGIALGGQARVYKTASTAIGYNLEVYGSNSVLLGSRGGAATRLDDSDVLAFVNSQGLYRLVNPDGTIPEERLSTIFDYVNEKLGDVSTALDKINGETI